MTYGKTFVKWSLFKSVLDFKDKTNMFYFPFE